MDQLSGHGIFRRRPGQAQCEIDVAFDEIEQFVGQHQFAAQLGMPSVMSHKWLYILASSYILSKA
jgi:hypothetical protein